MTMIHKKTDAPSPLLESARTDQASFTTLVEGCRRELLVHCYRMVASYHDAEDLVQETLLRAWKNRDTFEGRSSLRAWLYRIATNACLDFLKRKERKIMVADEAAPGAIEVPWLEPFPDRLLTAPAPPDDEPDARAITRESIELAFMVALQVLSAKQRAAVILCDVLDWTAREAAELLESTPAAVSATLARARETLARHRRPMAAEWKPGAGLGEPERRLVQAYMDAADRGDAAAVALLLRDDVRFTMPPECGWFTGRDVVVGAWVEGGFGSADFGELRCTLTSANGMPAVANYHRKPGLSEYRALALDVLTIEGGVISEIVAFPLDATLCSAFGIPEVLPA